MKLTYDPRFNAAYIYLREKTTQAETVRISDELNIDLAPDGTVYGLELLNANQQLAAEHKGTLLLVNEEVAQSSEIDLPR